MAWQLRSTPAGSDLRPALVEVLKKTRFSRDGTLLTFGVESPLLKRGNRRAVEAPRRLSGCLVCKGTR